MPQWFGDVEYSAPRDLESLENKENYLERPFPEIRRNLAFIVSSPLKATFAETERSRPSRKFSSFPERKSVQSRFVDPISKIVSQCMAVCPPLQAGKILLDDTIILSGKGVKVEPPVPSSMAAHMLPAMTPAKRPRDTPIDEGSANKKIKRSERFDLGDDDSEVVSGMVLPENVVRMIDRSLVDTPEKAGDSPFGIRFQQRLAAGGGLDAFTTPLVSRYSSADESAAFYTTPAPSIAFGMHSVPFTPAPAW